MDKLEIRVLVESMYGDESPTPGSSAAESRASMLGAYAGASVGEMGGGGRSSDTDWNFTPDEMPPKLRDKLYKQVPAEQEYGKEYVNTKQFPTKRGILRHKYSGSFARNDGVDTKFASIGGPLFEKGTWFQENNIPKVARSLGVAAVRETIDVAVSIQKYQSSNASKNHELDKTMKLANYGASIGIAAAINPVAGAAVAAGIVISEIGSYIKQSSEYKYDQRLAGQNRETVRAAAGNLSYGRPRGD